MAMTFDEFLSQAVSDCVNAKHGQIDGVGDVIAAAIRDELRQTDGVGDPEAWGKVECGDCGCYVYPRREHRCR